MTLVGRTAEQRTIASLVDAVRAGRTQVLLISGPSGIGKSHLAGSVSSEIPTYTHLLLESEAEVQFGAIDRLLDEQLPETTRELVALRDTVGIPTFAIKVVNLIEGLGEPFALVVDDLDYLDRGSQDAFWHVLRRLDRVPALFIATMRNLNGTFATRLLQHITVGRRGAHIQLGPLDAEGVQAFIRNSLFVPLRPRQLDSVLRATGGSPRLLRALVERINEGSVGSLEGAIDALAADSSTIPRSWPAAVELLSPADRVGLLAIALGGPMAPRQFDRTIARLGTGRPDVGAIRSTGLLDEKHLVLRETGIAASIAAMSGSEETRRVHAALGEVLTGIERLRHLVAASEGVPSPALAAELVEGARDAARVWDFALAHKLASWACSIDPAQLPLSCLYAIRSRRAVIIQSLGPQVRALLPGPTRTVLLAAIEALGPDVVELPAIDGIPLADLDDTPLLVLSHVAARLMRTRLSVGAGRTPPLIRAVRDELASRIAGSTPDEILAEMRTMQGILTVWMTFENASHPYSLVRAAESNVEAMAKDPAGSPALGAALVVAAALNHCNLENTAAAEQLDRASRLPFMPPVFAVESAIVRFKLAFLGGDWDAAQSVLEDALTFALDDLRDVGTLQAQALSALVPLCRGDQETGERLLDHSTGLAASRRFSMAMGTILWTNAWVGTANGDAWLVNDSLSRLWSSPLTGLFAGPLAGVLRVRAHMAQGDPADARAARAQLVTTELDPAVMDYLRHHCDALIADAGGDEAALDYAAARRALDARLRSDGGQGLLLMRVVLAEDCATSLLASGATEGHRACVDELEWAVALLWRIGATAWWQRLEALLASMKEVPGGDRSADGALDGFESLTAREREIAALVLKGESNKQIAAELVVSVRTVEFHVRNLLAKLRASSRVELRSRLNGSAH